MKGDRVLLWQWEPYYFLHLFIIFVIKIIIMCIEKRKCAVFFSILTQSQGIPKHFTISELFLKFDCCAAKCRSYSNEQIANHELKHREFNCARFWLNCAGKWEQCEIKSSNTQSSDQEIWILPLTFKNRMFAMISQKQHLKCNYL